MKNGVKGVLTAEEAAPPAMFEDQLEAFRLWPLLELTEDGEDQVVLAEAAEFGGEELQRL